ncbi:hypothetical protein GCM10009800_05590 [Nocardiopsis rhodophaea]
MAQAASFYKGIAEDLRLMGSYSPLIRDNTGRGTRIGLVRGSPPRCATRPAFGRGGGAGPAVGQDAAAGAGGWRRIGKCHAGIGVPVRLFDVGARRPRSPCARGNHCLTHLPHRHLSPTDIPPLLSRSCRIPRPRTRDQKA